MNELVFFLFSFLFCFIGRLLLYLTSKLNTKKSKKKNLKVKNSGISMEIRFLSTKFKLSEKRLDKKIFATLFSFLDALIISGTLLVVTRITKNMVLQMVLAFIFLLIFIYLVYGIIGNILILKGYDKDEL